VTSPTPISFSEATRAWVRVALLSFGGPAGQIAVMHRILVEEKRWISEERFLHALSYCMLLPGPEAQQLATYIGWLLHGTRGGLVAGLLFILPGLVAIMALSFVYVIWGGHPLLAGVFLGLKAAVIALVLEALIRLGRRALKTASAKILAVVAFVAIAVLRVPFPLVVLAAGVAGYLLARRTTPVPAAAASREAASQPAAPAPFRWLRVLALWLPLWFAPVLIAALLVGPEHRYTQLGVFFSQMAVVSFGGAYAVLAYVAQQAVERFGWITAGQMMDGLGLAESTPGPLIMVVQFVGFLAAYQSTASAYPLAAGVIGALITVWVTFVPSFLWIFLGAPYVERLRGNVAWNSALNAITAAVVGVIASLALWFAVHVLFADVDARGLPDIASLQWKPAALTAIALLLLFAIRWRLARTLLVCAALGAALAPWGRS
jgi:chromate transporter